MSDIIERLYEQYLDTRIVTTDTRQISKGCIFFGFRGATFDGNAFAGEALERGAALCVISDERYAVDDRCIVVDDVLTTLQALATHHRSHLHLPVIGITGTNGKTTTKELVREVLSRRYRVHATEGNHNNHLGVPLTLLSMPADSEIMIVEMGANHPGEIADLCAIAQPTCGLITNVGLAHLEGFGSLEGVVQTKTELYRHLSVVGGIIVVNIDNQRLMAEAERVCQISEGYTEAPGSIPAFPIVDFDSTKSSASMLTYGTAEGADVKGSLMDSNPYMRYYIERGDTVYTIQSQLVGDYNFDNAMAATAVGLLMGVDAYDIKEAIESYTPSNNRSQFLTTEHNRLLLDCYNANPSSMQRALANFAQMDMPHKMVILGGMRELGASSATEHQRLLDQIERYHFEQVILVGDELAFSQTETRESKPLWFATTEALIDHLSATPPTDKTILIKGSNSNHLWKIEQYL